MPIAQQTWAGAHDPGSRRLEEFGVGDCQRSLSGSVGKQAGDRGTGGRGEPRRIVGVCDEVDGWIVGARQAEMHMQPVPWQVVERFRHERGRGTHVTGGRPDELPGEEEAVDRDERLGRQEADLELPRAVLLCELMDRDAGRIEVVEDPRRQRPPGIEPLDREHPARVVAQGAGVGPGDDHELGLERDAHGDTEPPQALDLRRQHGPRIAVPWPPGIVCQPRERLRHARPMRHGNERVGIRDGPEVPRVGAEDGMRHLLVGDREVPVRHRERDALPGDRVETSARHGLCAAEAGVVVVHDPQCVGAEFRQPGRRRSGHVVQVARLCKCHCRLHNVAA